MTVYKRTLLTGNSACMMVSCDVICATDPHLFYAALNISRCLKLCTASIHSHLVLVYRQHVCVIQLDVIKRSTKISSSVYSDWQASALILSKLH